MPRNVECVKDVIERLPTQPCSKIWELIPYPTAADRYARAKRQERSREAYELIGHRDICDTAENLRTYVKRFTTKWKHNDLE